jgi:hypothetical protein
LEPRAVLRQVDRAAAPRPAFVTAPWARLVRSRFRAAGLLLADNVFGLAWSGAMTPARVQGLIRALPVGLTELYVHPGVAGGFDGAAPGYRYAEELSALVSGDTAAAVRDSGAALGSFSTFQSGGRLAGA